MTSAAKASPGGRRYQQFCPVARSLDVLGERWTLLLIRNLLMGPQRYTDLRDGLPGIATDILTARLRGLERVGYVERRQLPRPTPATVYQLTHAGQRIALIVLELARLGLTNLGTPKDGEDIEPSTLVLSLRASFRADVAGEVEESYQIELNEETFSIQVHPGWAETTRAAAAQPKLVLRTTPTALAELLAGVLTPRAALNAGSLEIDGSRKDLDHFFAIFAYPQTMTATDSAAGRRPRKTMSR